MDDICGAKNERENERIILRAKSRWTSISTRSPLNFTRAERLGCHDGDDGWHRRRRADATRAAHASPRAAPIDACRVTSGDGHRTGETRCREG
jgi:hypothetical protein